MPGCFFAADLHGHDDRYEKLFDAMARESPAAVMLGGDLLPRGARDASPFYSDYTMEFLIPRFARLRRELAGQYPAVFLILGNDDPRCEEDSFRLGQEKGVWQYIHDRRVPFAGFDVYGYAFVPPTPFSLKDWERYDVSRYVDPGCIPPEEGIRSTPALQQDLRWRTIREDLNLLTQNAKLLDRAIFLFHAPPHGTPLDRAALDGKTHDHAPLDLHVGSIAIRRFIEDRQPLLTLHGHVHESARLTGMWKTEIGSTVCINAAHDGPELSLVHFDPDCPRQASRELL